MKKTKKALASLAIAGMSLSMIPFNVFAAAPVPTRLAGVTAEQTAVQIAEQTGYTGSAILASSTSYGMVDALTAGPLAASLKAPILLTGAGNSLDAATKAELTKLAVKKVYVTSGTAVIKQGVIDELKGMGIEVEALGGFDRAETSVNIAKKMTGVTKVAVANTVVDALSIAAVASAANEPILLTDRDALPASVAAYLASAGVTSSDVIGGTGVISDAVAGKLPSATRHAGMSAYDTNNQVIQDFAASLAFDNVYVANGVTGIDALAGAPLAAQTKSPIVLTDGKTVPAAAGFTFSKAPVGAVVTALGGEFVVPETVRAGVAAGAVTPDSNLLQIVSVSSLDDSNKYLEIVFSKAVYGLQASDITLKNADTGARYGIKDVKMSSNGLTATVELYAVDDDAEVLAYQQDYVVTVNANGTVLTTTFNRPYSYKLRVQEINVADKEITGTVDKGQAIAAVKTFEVPESLKFDYEAALGEFVQVWVNADLEVVKFKVLTSDAKTDAIEVNDDADEITLIGEDKDVDVSTDLYTNTNKERFKFYLDGELDDIADHAGEKFNFAKVGLDASGDVEFVSAYSLKDTLIVDSIDGDEIVGVEGSSSFDAEDATIVKDGKVIAIGDVKAGDVVFYSDDANDDDGYAVVLNNKVATGEIENVYEDAIEVDGKTYEFNYDAEALEFNYSNEAVYINEDGEVDDMDSDAAESLQAAGDVTLYADLAGNLIYVSGDTALVDGNTKIAVLTKDVLGYTSARDKIEIEAVTEDGDEVSYDMDLEDFDTFTLDGVEKDVDNGGTKDYTATFNADNTDPDGNDADTKPDGIHLAPNGAGSAMDIWIDDELNAGSLVKLHLDDDGNLLELEAFSGTDPLGVISLEPGDKYLSGHKVTANTLLFDATEDDVDTDADDYVITAFGDYKGSELTVGNYILNDDDEVEAVWFSDTDNNEPTYDEAVVTSVLRNKDGEVVSISVYAGGETKTFEVDKFDDNNEVRKGDVVVLEMDENDDTLVTGIATATTDITYSGHDQYDERVSEGLTVDSAAQYEGVDLGDKTVKFAGDANLYRFADSGLVLDVSNPSDIKKKSLVDLRGKSNVTMVMDSTSTNFVKFFVYGVAAAADTTAPTASVTTATVNLGANVTTAQSTEVGTAYLKLDAANLTTKAALDAAVTAGTATKATVTAAATNTTIATTGLVAGAYKVVTVDAAGNVSAESTNTITLQDLAPTATKSSTGATKLVLTFSEALSVLGTPVEDGDDISSSFVATPVGGGSAIQIESAIYNATTKKVTITVSGAVATDTIEAVAATIEDATGNAYVPVTYTLGVTW